MTYMKDFKCPVCKNEKIKNVDTNRTDTNYYDCDVCGKFLMTFEAAHMAGKVGDSNYTLSSHIREYNEYNCNQTAENLITIGTEHLDMTPPGIDEKINKFLLYIKTKQGFEGANVEIYDSEEFAVLFYCKSIYELRVLIQIVQDLGYCEFVGTKDKHLYKLTYGGIKYINALGMSNLDSKQCFVAMSFSDEHKEIYTRGIKPAIEGAGNLNVYRVDEDIKHDEKIDNKIIVEIKKSRFLVADFTGNKHNVYYEVGYAMGYKLPVIFTCQKDSFDEEQIKFDLRQYPFIVFNDLEELKRKLTDAIKARIL